MLEEMLESVSCVSWTLAFVGNAVLSTAFADALIETLYAAVSICLVLFIGIELAANIRRQK